jgi:hypothetical protein
MLQNFFKHKNITRNLKLKLKNTIIDKTLTLNPLMWKIWRAPNNARKWQLGFNSAFKGLPYASETWKLTERDRKKMNIFERKVYRRILSPVYENEKENWRILTNKEIYARVKILTITEKISLNRLC